MTGVRTGELRLATPDQFDLDRGLWIIPVMSLKQRKMLTRKKRKRPTDIPPYIVPLSVQAMEIVRHMLDDFKPAQKYLFAGVERLTDRMSENTLNAALKRMGYEDRLTSHGIRDNLDGTQRAGLSEGVGGRPCANASAGLFHRHSPVE